MTVAGVIPAFKSGGVNDGFESRPGLALSIKSAVEFAFNETASPNERHDLARLSAH